MVCKRCGNEFAENITVCPQCGTVITKAQATAQSHTNYLPLSSQTGEGAQPRETTVPPLTPPYSSYTSIHHTYQASPPPTFTSSTFGTQASVLHTSHNHNNAMAIEIMLSLIGIFGVGWLLTGETTIGIILLVCSVCIYWPIMLFGTVFTLGLGLLCLGPLAIGMIILNTVFFNTVLKRKTLLFTPMQAQRARPRVPQE